MSAAGVLTLQQCLMTEAYTLGVSTTGVSLATHKIVIMHRQAAIYCMDACIMCVRIDICAFSSEGVEANNLAMF